MAEGMMYKCLFDGSISGHLCEIDRRPYHRNCGCALHQAAPGCPHRRCENVSYPITRSWSEGTLGLAMSAANTLSPSSSLAPAPASASASAWENSLMPYN
ncbi:hypothetical protein vseg_000016 [Gypsophila vaccaria]